MSNFTFLKAEWPHIFDDAYKTELFWQADPRISCFYARHALEQTVNWLFDYDRRLHRPYDAGLAALLNDRGLKGQIPPPVYHHAQVIRKVGNKAVHEKRAPKSPQALTIVKALYHVLYWLGRTYTQHDPASIPTEFSEDRLPQPKPKPKPITVAELQKYEAELRVKDEQLRQQAETIADYKAQLAAQQAQFEANKARNQRIPDPHNYSEAETRSLLLDLYLQEAGWDPHGPNVAEYKVTNIPPKNSTGYADYVLWGADGLPLAVIEAKKTSRNAAEGQQQAQWYADGLTAMHGQRPIIFYTNGYDHFLWDDQQYPPRPVQRFYTHDELQRLIQRRTTRQPLADLHHKRVIVDRDYQEAAIRHLTEHFTAGFRRGLIVMATGTGKTRTVIALCDLLMRANWVKRILFLADRTALVKQAITAFKKHLPAANAINLLEDKQAEASRVVVSTYQTMIGLLNQTNEQGRPMYNVGHFDLLIIDEAHRSVYRKFGAIFDYFDSLLIGLTATPKDELDRNTYDLFELERGVPTFAYSLEEGIVDGHLVPPQAYNVPLKFLERGIRYDELSADEQAEWDELDWGESEIPDEIRAADINKWLFNRDTVDAVLRHLMSEGLKVAGGDRLGKTIVFAKNQKHAEFILARFDAHYPNLRGAYAAIISYKEARAQTLIERFSQADSSPHIAISVDMLDTGIDVPEVVNLVFFKPIYSKTKFIQMLGRGTRLCPDLFGPNDDKTAFYVFDYCGNFEFFDLHPQGIEARPQEPLSQRLFKLRAELLGGLQRLPASKQPDEQTDKQIDEQPDEQTEIADLRQSLAAWLHERVAAMSLDNFIVRPQRQHVEPFQHRARWERLSHSDVADLLTYVSGLPTQLPEEPESAKRFDSLILQLQLAKLEQAPRQLRLQNRVMEIAHQLEQKANIDAVAAQLPLIRAVQDESYWQTVGLPDLEQLRVGLRDLIRMIDRTAKAIIYTDFKDELGQMQETQASYLVSGVNMAQYRYKVEQFIRQHESDPVIEKIRWGERLTAADLEQLERFFFEAAETESREAFEAAYGKQANLGRFIRQIVGLNRKAVKQKFADFLDGKRCTKDQIGFVTHLITQLTKDGLIDPNLLYESPFTDFHEAGLDGLFASHEADELVTIIKGINHSVEPLAV